MPSCDTPEDVGFINIDSWSEQSFAVPIQHFDFDALDDPEGFIKEKLQAGKPILHPEPQRESS